MKTALWTGGGVALAAAGMGAEAAAQGAASAEFAAPVRIEAGDKWAGERRLYPSPAMHDVDGDGYADLVVGDLPGRVTVALRTPGEGKVTFGPEKPMKDRRGEHLKFNNW
ncbi:MAG: FG-GAP repeat protein [Planctomycetota bacterium]